MTQDDWLRGVEPTRKFFSSCRFILACKAANGTIRLISISKEGSARVPAAIAASNFATTTTFGVRTDSHHSYHFITTHHGRSRRPRTPLHARSTRLTLKKALSRTRRADLNRPHQTKWRKRSGRASSEENETNQTQAKAGTTPDRPLPPSNRPTAAANRHNLQHLVQQMGRRRPRRRLSLQDSRHLTM